MQKETVASYVDHLWDLGRRYFEQTNTVNIDPYERCKLIGLMIRECPKQNRHEFITERDDFDEALLHLSDYLVDFECEHFSEDVQRFVISIINSAKRFSEKQIKELFIKKGECEDAIRSELCRNHVE